MYPFVRLLKDMAKANRQPALDVLETHVSHHICWPWDLDLWRELNNGRTLTLYDLGRIPMAQRIGLIATLRQENWGLTIAGSVVRYRRRIRVFDRIETHSRVLGWDRRFTYLDQSMWRTDGECASHAVFRAAVTDHNGIVSPQRVMTAMGRDQASPDLPVWVQKWIDCEDARPWPPEKSNR